MIDVSLMLHLDKDQVRELGLDDSVEVGDEVKVTGVAKVTKSRRPSVASYGPGAIELEITKISVDTNEPEQEPMSDYAKRRNAELRER
jgi:hypothetical protein